MNPYPQTNQQTIESRRPLESGQPIEVKGLIGAEGLYKGFEPFVPVVGVTTTVNSEFS